MCYNTAMESINLLFALDDFYVPQLKVLLTSLYINNTCDFHLYLFHSGLKKENQESLLKFVNVFHWNLEFVEIDETIFTQAVSDRYPKQMYYRLLAPSILKDIDRIIYLDPDILIINSLEALWNLDLEDKVIAAAAHTQTTDIANTINKVRLNTEHDYYNSGVLLIDLEKAREVVDLDHLFDYVKEHENELLFPDQDVLNSLYGKYIKPLDDYIWNYDARNYSRYLLRSQGRSDVDWVIENTSILHFCGKAKPWKKNYRYRFGVLYKHYMKLMEKVEAEAN